MFCKRKAGNVCCHPRFVVLTKFWNRIAFTFSEGNTRVHCDKHREYYYWRFQIRNNISYKIYSVVVIFFQVNIFIQQGGCSKVTRSDNKDLLDYISNNCCFYIILICSVHIFSSCHCDKHTLTVSTTLICLAMRNSNTVCQDCLSNIRFKICNNAVIN